MADFIKHKKVVIAQTDVSQPLSEEYFEAASLNIHSKTDNQGVAYFGASTVSRSGVNEMGTPLFQGQNLPFDRADLSRLYVTGDAGDIFLLTYFAGENS